jgi:hypothetical protein
VNSTVIDITRAITPPSLFGIDIGLRMQIGSAILVGCILVLVVALLVWSCLSLPARVVLLGSILLLLWLWLQIPDGRETWICNERASALSTPLSTYKTVPKSATEHDPRSLRPFFMWLYQLLPLLRNGYLPIDFPHKILHTFSSLPRDSNPSHFTILSINTGWPILILPARD